SVTHNLRLFSSVSFTLLLSTFLFFFFTNSAPTHIYTLSLHDALPISATLLKQGRLETALVGRGLEGFQRRVEVELQPSGVMELDAVLGGGFPRGSLVELYGPASSGKTAT